ncbi:hypothetical protein Tco_0934872 [Tanacetum coccineum]
MFAATTHENTPMAYRGSTLANPNLVISLDFVEANYEALESLLRDRQREMELRRESTRDATPPLRIASPRIHRRWGKEQWGLKELKVEEKAGSKGTLKGEGL